jgi:hypothetical protein
MDQHFAGSNEIQPFTESAVLLTVFLLIGIEITAQRTLITRYLSRVTGLCTSLFLLRK